MNFHVIKFSMVSCHLTKLNRLCKKWSFLINMQTLHLNSCWNQTSFFFLYKYCNILIRYSWEQWLGLTIFFYHSVPLLCKNVYNLIFCINLLKLEWGYYGNFLIRFTTYRQLYCLRLREKETYQQLENL